jgi:hypothetical protein
MLFSPFDSFVSTWQRADACLKLFAFVLVIVAIVSFVGALQTWAALRRVRRAGGSDSASLRGVIATLERGCASRAARLQLMFYLFAAVISLALVRCYFQIALSKVPIGLEVLGDMGFVFAFAYRCSLVFAIVHVVQLITASCVAASRAAQSIAF